MEDYSNFDSVFNEKYSQLTRKIVRILSEDSRTPVATIAKSVNVSRRTAKERIVRIEKELQIHYTLELDEEVLGIPSPHLIVLRFSSKPNYGEISKLLGESSIPQLAVKTKDDESLFIYANAPSTHDYIHWEKTLQMKLSKYKAVWESSEVAHKQLGFFPIRNELIDRLNMPEKYKMLLKILNKNSRITFHEISKITGMHFNTVAYNFNKLIKLGYIKKFTLVSKPPSDVCLMAIFGKYALEENFESDALRIRRIFKDDQELSVFARYPIIAQLTGSYDFFDVGIFDDAQTANKQFVGAYKTLLKRHLARIYSRELSDVILGDFPLRSMDSNKDYRVLKWTSEE